MNRSTFNSCMEGTQFNKYKSNLWKLFLVMVLTSDVMLFGILVIYMIFQGLSIGQTSIVIAIWTLVSALSQIPAGIFADRFGLKKSIVLGAFLSLLGILLFTFGNNFLMFAIGYGVLGLGAAFIQGADVALLYESLAKMGSEFQFKSTYGRMLFWADMYAVLLSVIGGLLYGLFSEATPFWVQSFLIGAGVLVSVSLVPIITQRKQISVKKQLKKIYSQTFYKRNFSKVFLISGLIGSISITTFQYLQPLYKGLEIPEVYFGALGAGAFLMRGIGGRYSSVLGKIFSIDHYLILHSVLFGILLLIVSEFASVPLIVIAVAIMFFLRGLYAPTVNHFINLNVKSEERATMLSINSQLLFITSAATLLLMGFIVEEYGLGRTFYSIAMLSLLFLLMYVLIIRKVRVE